MSVEPGLQRKATFNLTRYKTRLARRVSSMTRSVDPKTLEIVIALLLEEQKLNSNDPVVVSLLQRIINRLRELKKEQ